MPYYSQAQDKFFNNKENFSLHNFPLSISCALIFVVYNTYMKILSFLCLLCLCACGPREIGQGYSEIPSGSGNYSAAEQMRFPMTGANNTQKMLYYYNRPDVMEKVRDWRLEQFQRALGAAPSPEDPAYRAVPKQPSPFRE